MKINSGLQCKTALLLIFCSFGLLSACSDDSTTTGTDVVDTGDSDDSGDSNDALDPLALPDPPLTSAPSDTDEPTVESGDLNTVTDYTVVRNTGELLMEEITPELTEEDFQAGPLEPVYYIPADIDQEVNAIPYFENLEDQLATAGQTLEVLFKPVDPDGDTPGMFPRELPRGASFRDNRDTTKSLVWLPLQTDVGIHEFTVTAIDKLAEDYRTERTIRIKVSLPEDLSTIPNVAPELVSFLPNTVRVNDPVILELKATDPNGQIPTLEVAEPPAGSTFVQHPDYEEVWVLRFVPTTAGVTSIDVTARDAEDSSLTSVTTVNITALDAADFERPGRRLRELADERGFEVGFAARREFYHRPDGALYASIAAEEFNFVTSENSLNMDVINPSPGRYQFADVDNLVSFAAFNDMEVHGPPLIWYTQLPDWIKETDLEDRRGHMQEYIHRVLTRYKNSINIWALVNEAIGENGGMRDSIWFEAMGEEYIDIAFRQARQTQPDATLLLNDFDTAVDGPKKDTFFPLLERLIAREVPFDGVGFQLHISAKFDQFDEVRENFQRVADLGLEIHVTELDVSITDDSDEIAQANVYQEILSICLEQPACIDLQTWGYTDRYSWRSQFSPLMFDDNYQVKPAYTALQERLADPE